MDYNQYENFGFDRISAFNLATGVKERSYQRIGIPMVKSFGSGPERTICSG